MIETPPDRSTPRVVHIVGIGGAGMSGIATVLARMGHRVSGSDLKDSPALERLELLDVTTAIGHRHENLPADVDFVVVSTAIPSDNPEVRAAAQRGIPVLRRAEGLRLIAETRRTVAVSGTHGKTTTSSMLAVILRAAGWRPSFLIGGEVNEVGANAVYDEGEWLVVEADESDGTFIEIPAEAVVVTNVEPDHLEHYGDFERLVAAFHRFVSQASGPAVICVDDDVARGLVEDASRPVTYGFADDATYRLAGYEGGSGGSTFELRGPGGGLGAFELPVPGRHNALNATAAAVAALELGADADAVRSALARFTGVSRRFQVRGSAGGVTYVDDYAHLPSEVEAAIAAAHDGDWSRVVVVFQPHRFSRTASLWRDFADAFDRADVVVLTDIYGAGEAPRPGVSGRLVLQAVTSAHPGTRVVYLPRRADLEHHVAGLTRPGDVVLTLGAGDITSMPDAWLAREGATA